MNDENTYRRHLLLNAPLAIGTYILSIAVLAIPWSAGMFHTLLTGTSLLALCYSHYVIQSHEIRTLIRIVIVIDGIFLALATPIAYQ